MSSSSTSPPDRATPHVRLNSAQEDLISNDSNTTSPRDPPRPSNSRSLTGQSRPTTAPSIRNNPGLQGLYGAGPAPSEERLLPPSRTRTRRFRDEESAPNSPTMQSRRTSFDSDTNSRDSRIYGSNPFADSRAPSRAGSDDDNVNTQTVSEKYTILPSAGLLLFPEDVEKDDWLHNPDPNEKERRECDIFTKRGFVNIGGLSFLTLGILVLFIGYPILWVHTVISQIMSRAKNSQNLCTTLYPS